MVTVDPDTEPEMCTIIRRAPAEANRSDLISLLQFESMQKTHAISIVPPVLEMQPRVVGEACLS